MADEPEPKSDAEIWADLAKAEEKAEPPPPDEGEVEAEAPPAEVAAEPSPPVIRKARGRAQAEAPIPEEPDPWAAVQLPEDLRSQRDAEVAELDRLRRAEKTLQARVRTQAEELQLAKQAAVQRPQKTEEEGSSVPFTERVESLREEYPELSPVFDALLAQSREVEVLKSGMASVGSDRYHAAISRNEELLTEAIPDWRTLVTQPEFQTWIAGRPQHVQEAYKRNYDAVTSYDEAFDLVESYRVMRQSGGTTAAGNGSNGRDGASVTSHPGLSDHRRRQLAGARSIRSVSPGATPGGIPESGDPQEIWNAWKRRDEEQARSQHR